MEPTWDKITEKPVYIETNAKFSEDNFPPYSVILQNLEETKREQEFVTGKDNIRQLQERIGYLTALQTSSPEWKILKDANKLNYEPGMSFSTEQIEFAQTLGNGYDGHFHDNDIKTVEKIRNFTKKFGHFPADRLNVDPTKYSKQFNEQTTLYELVNFLFPGIGLYETPVEIESQINDTATRLEDLKKEKGELDRQVEAGTMVSHHANISWVNNEISTIEDELKFLRGLLTNSTEGNK